MLSLKYFNSCTLSLKNFSSCTLSLKNFSSCMLSLEKFQQETDYVVNLDRAWNTTS